MIFLSSVLQNAGGRGAYPAFGFRFLSQVGEWLRGFFSVISYGGQIGIVLIFPTVTEFFGYSSATFGETGIANALTVHEQLAACGADSFGDCCVRCFGDSLITLAVVVGTHVEDGVVFAVIPADVFVFGLHKGEESFILVA